MCYLQNKFRVGALMSGSVASPTSRSTSAARSSITGSKRNSIIDVVPGRGSGFSLEAAEGVRFLTRRRVFTDDEADELAVAGPPLRGDAVEVEEI